MLRARAWGERLRGRLSRAVAGEDGSAALEFVTVGCLLLVPLVYLVVALGTIQGHALGVESGARQLARVLASGGSGAPEHAGAVLASVVDAYGLDEGTVRVSYDCLPAGPSCPAPGVMLTVTVDARSALPLVPSLLEWDRAASVPVQGVAVQRISRTWDAP